MVSVCRPINSIKYFFSSLYASAILASWIKNEVSLVRLPRNDQFLSRELYTIVTLLAILLRRLLCLPSSWCIFSIFSFFHFPVFAAYFGLRPIVSCTCFVVPNWNLWPLWNTLRRLAVFTHKISKFLSFWTWSQLDNFFKQAPPKLETNYSDLGILVTSNLGNLIFKLLSPFWVYLRTLIVGCRPTTHVFSPQGNRIYSVAECCTEIGIYYT